MNPEFRRTWKEVVCAYLGVLFENFVEELRINMKVLSIDSFRVEI
jgi:hypothetical protein